VLAACAPKLDLNGLPFGGGGGGGTTGGSGGPDGPTNPLDAPNEERVCLTTDARQLTFCQMTGAANLTVAFDGQMATTSDDGAFTIQLTNTIGEWIVTGTNIVTSQMPFSPSLQIPALSTNTYSDLTNSNGVVLSQGQGSIFVQITQNGGPLVNATVTASPAAQYATFYDGNNPTAWNSRSTGLYGVAWIPGLDAGSATVTVTPGTGMGSAVSVPGIAVGDGANTYVTIDIPPPL